MIMIHDANLITVRLIMVDLSIYIIRTAQTVQVRLRTSTYRKRHQ